MDGLTVDATIAILVSLANHLINLVICELLANGCHDVTELGCRDETVVVTVKHLMWVSRHTERVQQGAYLEGFPNLLLGIGVLHLAGHHGEEL